jgi:hypothetical protein
MYISILGGKNVHWFTLISKDLVTPCITFNVGGRGRREGRKNLYSLHKIII